MQQAESSSWKKFPTFELGKIISAPPEKILATPMSQCVCINYVPKKNFSPGGARASAPPGYAYALRAKLGALCSCVLPVLGLWCPFLVFLFKLLIISIYLRSNNWKTVCKSTLRRLSVLFCFIIIIIIIIEFFIVA